MAHRLQHLLAATDFSAPARHAADRAALVARESGATLDLLHVAALAPLQKFRRLVGAVPERIEQQMLDAARDELAALAAVLHRHHGVAAGVHVRSGALLAELAAQVGESGADLVVLGARGASFMRHVLLGSTAERMIGRATRPMLVVKQAAHEAYRSVLVPVDFSPSSERTLRDVRTLAPGADIVLLHAFEVPFEGKLRLAGVEDDVIHRYRGAARKEALERMRALAAGAGLEPQRTRMLVVHGEPWQHIIEQEQEQDCDLVAVGKHGESPVEDVLLGSVTRHVLTQSQGDVLVSV